MHNQAVLRVALQMFDVEFDSGDTLADTGAFLLVLLLRLSQ